MRSDDDGEEEEENILLHLGGPGKKIMKSGCRSQGRNMRELALCPAYYTSACRHARTRASGWIPPYLRTLCAENVHKHKRAGEERGSCSMGAGDRSTVEEGEEEE